MLICTHAASMIVIGRVLTGRMPEDVNGEDFRCGTCALSVFGRKKEGIRDAQRKKMVKVEMWDKDRPDMIPYIEWQNGKGVGGGWVCEVNGDCSFLSGGEERSWLVAPLFLLPSILVVPFPRTTRFSVTPLTT